MYRYYVLDEHKNAVETKSALDAEHWAKTNSDIIKKTTIKDEYERSVVTTKLKIKAKTVNGVTTPWIVQVSGGYMDNYSADYSTKAEALAAHQRVCAKVVATM